MIETIHKFFNYIYKARFNIHEFVFEAELKTENI
ncbi:hypothetical protein [Pieris rapae granulovirus]|nr:hypothetical protein [Pieris rapae granulovirus]